VWEEMNGFYCLQGMWEVRTAARMQNNLAESNIRKGTDAIARACAVLVA
jgi:hypothetical protein